MEWGWSEEFPGLAGVYRDGADRNERLAEWLGPWNTGSVRRRTTSSTETTSSRSVAIPAGARGSGAMVDTKGAHLWTLRDGKVIRLEVFADGARALAAAGLTGPPYSQ